MKLLNRFRVSVKIIAGYIMILFLFIIVATMLVVSLNGLTSDFAFLVEHDQPVLANAARLEKLAVDMETGERGYLITGDEEFLEPYTNGLDTFDTLLQTEKVLVSDNPPQVARLERIEALHEEWLQIAAEPAIAMRMEANKAVVSAENLEDVLKEGVGKGLMDEMREILNNMETSLRAQDELESIILVTKIAKNLVDQETGQRGFLVTGDESFLEPYNMGRLQLTDNITTLRALLAEAEDSNNLNRLDQVESLAGDWLEQAAEPEISARQEMNNNPVTMTDVAALISAGTGKSILDQMRTEFDAFTAEENVLNAQRAEDAAQQSNMVEILTIGLTIASVIIGLGIGAVVSRAITVPLSEVTNAAAAVVQGDLSRRANVSTKDELGELAVSFNQMTDNLQERIEKETEMREFEQEANKNAVAKETIEQAVNEYNRFIQRVAKGDLTARLSINGSNDDLTMLGRNLNNMVENLGVLATQMREATTNITASAAEILASTTQQASGAAEQSAAIAQTTTTIDEVRAIVEQSLTKARAVSDQAQQTAEVSYSGQQAVSDTVRSMSQIKERVAGIAENILALSEQTQQIGDIIATVNDIAAQSNLLALNASVEAARAGEHGKGFNVVAVEVRNLAEQSKQATSQVKQILNEIQRATNAAVMATEEGTKGVEDGVVQTEQSGTTIEQLAKSITESASAAQQIVASAQQQTTGMEQISLAMQNINQATVQSLASNKQAEKAAQDLAGLSRQMESIVAQYTLN